MAHLNRLPRLLVALVISGILRCISLRKSIDSDAQFKQEDPRKFPGWPSFSALITEHPQTFSQFPEDKPAPPHFFGGSFKYDADSLSSLWELYFNTYEWVGEQFKRLALKQVCKKDVCTASDRNGVVAHEGVNVYVQTLLELLSVLPAEGKYMGKAQVEEQECDKWIVQNASVGNLTVCVGSDSAPRSMTVEPVADRVGWSNVKEWAHNMTFHDIRIGDVGEIEQVPIKWGISGAKPCASNGTRSIQVLRALGEAEPKGALEDRDTFDWIGQGVTIGSPKHVKFGGAKYLEMFDVEIDGKFGLWRDCNYKPSVKANVCEESHIPGWEKLVTRSSAEMLTGSSYMGMCDDNEVVGSWYTFPHEGKCGDNSSIGHEGCTWKLKSTKVIYMACVASFNSSGWERAWEKDYGRAPFPHVMAHAKAAVEACAEVRDAPTRSTAFSTGSLIVYLLVSFRVLFLPVEH